MKETNEERLERVRRMEKYLKSLIEEGYTINAGRYFLFKGTVQYEDLTEQAKIEIFAEGSRWVVYHEAKVVNITPEER